MTGAEALSTVSGEIQTFVLLVCSILKASATVSKSNWGSMLVEETNDWYSGMGSARISEMQRSSSRIASEDMPFGNTLLMLLWSPLRRLVNSGKVSSSALRAPRRASKATKHDVGRFLT